MFVILLAIFATYLLVVPILIAVVFLLKNIEVSNKKKKLTFVVFSALTIAPIFIHAGYLGIWPISSLANIILLILDSNVPKVFRIYAHHLEMNGASTILTSIFFWYLSNKISFEKERSRTQDQ